MAISRRSAEAHGSVVCRTVPVGSLASHPTSADVPLADARSPDSTDGNDMTGRVDVKP
jgi:hypothetical protein